MQKKFFRTEMQARTCIFFTLVVLACSCSRAPDPLPGFPQLVLWAWERPENLSYVVPAATGVCYLAGTVTFGQTGIERHPRMQPLWVPSNTPVMAVVRLESHGANRPEVADLTRAILGAVHGVSIRALQIDWDARASERLYYKSLMAELRRSLNANIPLEMTALVSWCQSDDWIAHMPVAEAVPMLFRMGADPHSTTEPIREPLCSSSIGISTDEFKVHVPRGKRVFVFTDRPWTEKTYRAVLTASRNWR